MIMKHLKYIFCVLVLLLYGCRGADRIVYVHDTIDNSVVYTNYKNVHDSVYVDRWHSVEVIGDTVYRIDSMVVYRWKMSYDTVVDSVGTEVLVPVEKVVVEKEKVRGLFWWCGLIVMVCLILYVAYKIVVKYCFKR